MGNSDNTKLIQDAYGAFGRGDIPGLLSTLSDDIEWEHAESADIPWAGKFQGHDGVVKFFTAIGSNADFLAFEPHTFIADGDKVVVLGRERSSTRPTAASGRPTGRTCSS